MKNRIRQTQIILLIIIFSGILYSCLESDNTEELQLEHDQAMANFKTKYAISEDDSIGDGIYMKILTQLSEQDTVFSNGKDQIVVDLLGIDPEDNVFDVTDKSIADSFGVTRGDYIYGPLRVLVQQTFSGFYKAIQRLPEGAEAVMLFPHDQAFGGYRPILYEVQLHRVIHDIDDYINTEFNDYREKLGMTLADTLPGYDSIYFKIVAREDTASHDIYYGDEVQIRLTARYAESDTAYVESFPGREYFPINQSGDSISFSYGTAYFPITEMIHIAVSHMKIGETWEILSPAKYVYGEDGFRHPTMSTIIVPNRMPVHYTIELLGYDRLYRKVWSK